MNLKASVSGKVICNGTEDANQCSKILDRYRINNIVKEREVEIKGEIKVTPMFDRNGFERLLERKLEKLGRHNISVSNAQ
jgi:hypothetical protein